MRSSAEVTRQRIVQAAYELFHRQGYARSSVDVIARKSGLTKRTLYHHFRSKDDLLASVIELQRRQALKRIPDWSDDLSGDANALLDRLFADLAFWADRPRGTGTGFTRVAMELADLPGHPARIIARHHKMEVEAWLAGQLAAREVTDALGKARQIMLLLEGCLSLLLIHGSKAYADMAATAAKLLVKSP